MLSPSLFTLLWIQVENSKLTLYSAQGQHIYRSSSFCRTIKVSFLPSPPPNPSHLWAWRRKKAGRIWKQMALTELTNLLFSVWAWTSCPNSKRFQFLILSYRIIGNDKSNFLRIVIFLIGGCKGYIDPLPMKLVITLTESGKVRPQSRWESALL